MRLLITILFVLIALPAMAQSMPCSGVTETQIMVGGQIEFCFNPNREPDIDGYRVYYNQDFFGQWIEWLDFDHYEICNSISCDTGLITFTESGFYIIAFTAYDNEDPSLESKFSNRVYVDVTEGVLILHEPVRLQVQREGAG